VNARARACAWVRTRRVCDTSSGLAPAKEGRRGGVHCGARSDAMGAVDKATAFGCKHVCKKTATGNMAFLPFGDRGRVPQGHGGVTAARPS
jgi:hypothetical protein